MIGLQESEYATENRLFVAKDPVWQSGRELGPVQPTDTLNITRLRASTDCATYRVATMREEVHSSMRLVHDAYVRLGLIRPNRFGLHVIPQHLLKTTEVLVAVRAEEVFATMTIVGDGEFGLPLESLYPDEVEMFRSRGLRVAEVSCLADKQEKKDQTAPGLFRLMALTAQRSRYAGVDLLLAVVHPRHAKFYERFLGFELFGAEKPYEKVCGAPAVALALDLDGVRQHNPRAYKRLFGEPFPTATLERCFISQSIRDELATILDETCPHRGSMRLPAVACV